ncbi:hypothetical protein DPEC_G00148430 [Dallia pectoralis]|uniref:Uncharacterized protein n=1 Tax=Dallia pectoralis TaxID=75939 RepID=A0ACC2GI92_DALPE|nr:hypothetical protein DPEC_G00148430 [Dallia pectoralis]
MKHRTVMMYTQIGCFVSCLSGWILVSSTLAIEYWIWSEVSNVVLTTSNYFSNLWRDCVSDTTGVSDCKDYPSMMALSGFLHAARALSVCSVILGFFAGVLTLIGMKCTKIGGSELANARVTFAGGITYLASGFCGLIVYSWWGNKVRSEFVDPNFRAQKYELGAAIFIGWGGSLLLITGGSVLGFFSGKEGLRSTSQKTIDRPYSIPLARSTRTNMTAKLSRGTRLPPLIIQESRSVRESRTTRTSGTYNRDAFV